MPVQALVQCINQFALQETNPVISILPDSGVVKANQKYPRPMMTFSGIGLRAYYHCHTSDSRPEMEHGHFHIFLKVDNEQWSHLAGLSMDRMGQPIQWFTVNRWVTGETWNTAEILAIFFNQLLESKTRNSDLVERWLLAMLGFYQQTINHLLEKRDQRLEELAQGEDIETTLKDHNIYDLSQSTVNLLSDLESYVNLYGKLDGH